MIRPTGIVRQRSPIVRENTVETCRPPHVGRQLVRILSGPKDVSRAQPQQFLEDRRAHRLAIEQKHGVAPGLAKKHTRVGILGHVDAVGPQNARKTLRHGIRQVGIEVWFQGVQDQQPQISIGSTFFLKRHGNLL